MDGWSESRTWSPVRLFSRIFSPFLPSSGPQERPAPQSRPTLAPPPLVFSSFISKQPSPSVAVAPTCPLPSSSPPRQSTAPKTAAYYAVAVGRNPGIYADWPACRGQVVGFPGAKYKKFVSRSDAAQYVRAHRRNDVDSEQYPESEEADVVTGAASNRVAADPARETTEKDGLGIRDPSTSSRYHGNQRHGRDAKASLERITVSLSNPSRASPPWTEWPHSPFIVNDPAGPCLLDLLRHELGCPRLTGVDVCVSYIFASGVKALKSALSSVPRPATIRVLATSQFGFTQAVAVHRLAQLPNVEVRIVTSTQPTFHAKGWIFHRGNEGGDVAVVGSSNLSWPALSTSNEWNIRVQERKSVAGEQQNSHGDACQMRCAPPVATQTFKNAFERLWRSDDAKPCSGSAGDMVMLENWLSRGGNETGMETCF